MSRKYDYQKAIKNDVMTYINENYNEIYIAELPTEGNEEKFEAFKEILYDELWVEDSVTGNASGSYTFSRYQAEEYLCHNTDLMWDALEEFGYETSERFEPETIDVIIRCYLLYPAIEEAIFDISTRVMEERCERAMNSESEEN